MAEELLFRKDVKKELTWDLSPVCQAQDKKIYNFF